MAKRTRKTSTNTKAASTKRANVQRRTNSIKSKPKFFADNKLVIAVVVIFALFGAIALYQANAAVTTASWQRFPGDSNPMVTNKAYWGASIGGNSDPSRHEVPTGESLSLRRTFWGWDNNRTKMITAIKQDISANRLPWVSTKTPKWAEVASGKHDAVLDDLLRKIDATGGPVWLTFYHEPEDNTDTGTGREKCEKSSPNSCEGTAADWRAMQKHVRERMNVIGTKNIAFAPIVMSWTHDVRSKRTPSDYWVDGVWDFYGVDHYQESEGPEAVAAMTSWTNFVNFTESKGKPYAVAEWGTRGTSDNDAKRVKDFWEWGFNNKKDILGYAYFDSELNSPKGSWELKGKPLDTFQQILESDDRVLRITDVIAPQTEDPEPTDTGNEDNNDNDGTLAIDITTPKAGSTISKTTTITAGPDTNVQEVSFRIDGKWHITDTSTPFTWDWDTTTSADGDHVITIRARKIGDPGNVYTERNISVKVKNKKASPEPEQPTTPKDTEKPTRPTSFKAALRLDMTKMQYVIDTSWSASSDDVSGVSHYNVERDSTLLGSPSIAKYTDSASLATNKTYRYSVRAVDGTGKVSDPAAMNVRTSCFLIFCRIEQF